MRKKKQPDLLTGIDNAAYPEYVASIGKRLQERYEFVGEHLAGKTGQTYRIRNRTDKQIYCLKTVRESLTDDKSRRRVRETLKKEVEILEPLSHRCLPRIFDHELSGALPFYVCTFHSGQTWEQFRASGSALPLDQALFVIASLIDALEYLHQSGRTHCDLHEENILISDRVLAEGILIIDYGSGHRESASASKTDDRGHLGFKAPWNIPHFREEVIRDLVGEDFQGNDYRALGRLLLLMEKPFFGTANTEQRSAYRALASGLLQSKINSWREVREHFEYVSNPSILLTRADRFLLREDGSRSFIPMPATAQVPVGESVLEIVNSKSFQRLRGIKQLSFCEWFYPGGTHTRFEHSLGVFGVAYSAIQHLARDKVFRENYHQKNVDGALLAALIHDIGHYPYAHVIEHYVAARYPGNDTLKEAIHHSKHSRHIIENDAELSTIIRDFWGSEVQEEAIRNLTGTSGILSEILDGPIDCDKLDYLRRDAHHCGVPYGQGLNVDRILGSFRCSPSNHGLVVAEDGVSAIEGMVLVQDQMLASVYWHETTRALFAMFHRFLDVYLGKYPERLPPLVDQLKACSSEYEALSDVFLPLIDEATGERKQHMIALIGLHRRHNFKEIYVCIVKYGPLDKVAPRERARENVYASIVKHNLTNLSNMTFDPTATMPIDWGEVQRLRSCFLKALEEKKINATHYDVLIDVPWGKGSNRVVQILRDDGREVPITQISHLNDSIFRLPTAHIAPVRVYLAPRVYRRAMPYLSNILATARDYFDKKIPIEETQES
jgi:HD superfamily phosphohydrolase